MICPNQWTASLNHKFNDNSYYPKNSVKMLIFEKIKKIKDKL